MKIALKLKSSLSDGVEKIRPSCPVYKGLKYQFAVKCKCGHKKDKKCARHRLEDRSSKDCVHFVPLDDFHGTRRCFLSCEYLDDEMAGPWINRKSES